MAMESQTFFSAENRVAPLGIVPLAGARELSEKVEAHLVRWAKRAGMDVDTFIIENSCPRFSSGDSKGLIKSTVRGYDLFFVVDVGNYSLTYNYFGNQNHMSPDDHYQDLKRLIQAASGKAHRVNVVMPLLYGGRQHRRSYRESLDCAYMLQELQQMGVSNVLTFDAHDPRVQNAVPVMGFDNLMPTYQVLKKLFKDFPDLSTDKKDFMIVSPDEGALNRNMYYASVLGVDMGMFYKRRDYSRIVDGRNPIVAHEFLGTNVEGKDVLIIDDMISSGESMIDTARELKKRKANRIFVVSTFGLFTNGFASFDKAYEEGLIYRVVTTNLIYQSPELLSKEYYISCDMSKYIAYLIDTLNHDCSISDLLSPYDRIKKCVQKYNDEQAAAKNK